MTSTIRRRRSGQVSTWLAVVTACLVVGARPASADVPGTGIVQEFIGGASGWAFDKVADGIASWVLDAVAFFVNGALDVLRTSARPDVEAGWFAGPGSPFAVVRNLAGVLLVGFVFLGLVQGLVQGDPAGMVRRIAGNLPLAVAGMVITTSVVARLLELTDAMSAAVLSGSDEQALHFLSGFGLAVTGASQGFAAVLLGLVAVLAALLLWIELMVRSSLIYLLVAMSPLGFAATLWPASRGLLRKTVELLLAVILSKFVISVALAIGVAGLSGAGEAGRPAESVAANGGASIGTLFVGAVLLGLAAFSPFLILKLFPVAEAALVAQGVSRGPARSAQTGLAAYSSTRMAARLSGSGSAGAPAGLVPTGAANGPALAGAGAASGGAAVAVAAGVSAARKAGAAATAPLRGTGDAPSGSSATSGPEGDS